MIWTTIITSFLAVTSVSLQAQPEHTDEEIQIDIPSLPLADALVAYSSRTGLQVFYDGALASGRRSTAISGNYSAMTGLQILLGRTGYVPRPTSNSDTITIVAAPQEAKSPVSDTNAQLRPYQPYFALLQGKIREALCASDTARAGDEQIILSLWLGVSGTIARAEVFGSDKSPVQRDALAATLRGVRLGQPPPLGLPQPVTMVIFPPSINESTGCAPPDRRALGN